MKLLLLLFLIVPLIEIYLLIEVGSLIGAIWTVFLVVFTAVLGALMINIQGVSTITRARAMMARGELPATEMLEGVALLISGAMLLTPGFFTDTIGFILLISPLRRALIQKLLTGSAAAFHSQANPRPDQSSHKPRTIEGESHRIDD